MDMSSNTAETQNRLTVLSIGTASAISAKAIADGLQTSSDKVAEKLYRAPAVLVDNLSVQASESLAELIQNLGIDVRIEPSDAPPPPPNELFDISIHFNDIESLPKVAYQLSAFLGTDTATIVQLLLTPPAIVLGNVSQATLQALSTRLDEPGVELIASRPTKALYSVIVRDLEKPQLQELHQFVSRMGLSLSNLQDFGITSIDYQTAQTIWKHFGHRMPIQIVNQDFYRYDIKLETLPETNQLHAVEYLENQIGIQTSDYDAIEPHLPLVIQEGVSQESMQEIKANFEKHHIDISCHNITFQRLHICITSTPSIESVNQVLQQLGLHDGLIHSLPFVTPRLTETCARLVKHFLEQNGAEVCYQEVTP